MQVCFISSFCLGDEIELKHFDDDDPVVQTKHRLQHAPTTHTGSRKVGAPAGGRGTSLGQGIVKRRSTFSPKAGAVVCSVKRAGVFYKYAMAADQLSRSAVLETMQHDPTHPDWLSSHTCRVFLAHICSGSDKMRCHSCKRVITLVSRCGGI